MAAAYVKISCARGDIRTFGGNRSAVRAMKKRYETMTLGEFMFKHEHLNERDYNTLTCTFYNKW
jgi:hypothetical protein